MTQCRRCNRTLKNPEAIKKEIGPVCERKEAIAKSAEKLNDEGGVLDEPSPHKCGKVILRRQNGIAMANIAHKYIRHSPTGFEWGYAGSGPADLARNICMQITGDDEGYQDFKFKFIASIPKEGGEIPVADIHAWKRHYVDALSMPLHG